MILTAPGDHVQVAQTEEVHLEQTELLHVAHRHLGDHLGVALLHQGQVVGERSVGDDHAGGVDGVLTDQPLERPGHVDHPLHLVVRVVLRPQVLLLFHAVFEGDLRAFGHELGDAVGGAVGHVHDPGGVAYGLTHLDGAEGGDLGHPIAAVLLGHVVDHPFAALHREIDVDVGHADAVRVEEALEQQVVGQGVEVGDAQQIGHDGARRRTPARAHGDAVALGVVHEVPDDEEVGRETHLLDDGQLHLQALPHLGARVGTVATRQPFLAPIAQVGRLGVPLGHLEARQVKLAELHGDVASLGHFDRVRDRLWIAAERLPHLGFVLEEELLRGEAHALLFVQAGTGLDAQQHVVGAGIVFVEVVHVVGGHQRQIHPLGQLGQAGRHFGQLGYAGLLDLDVDVLAPEYGDQPFDLPFGLGEAALFQGFREPARRATGETDEPLGVLAQEGVVDPRLGVVALEEGQAAHFEQVPVAVVVARQEGEMPLLLRLGILDEPIGHHVGLETDDRLDARRCGLLVELHRAAEDTVVGHGHRRHAVLHALAHEVVDLARPVQSRVVGVDVQVTEARGRRYVTFL